MVTTFDSRNIDITTVEISTAVFLIVIKGFADRRRLTETRRRGSLASIASVPETSSPMQSAPAMHCETPRPGRRGPGSKRRLGRSLAEFSAGYATVSSDRSYARTSRRRRTAERKEEERRRLAEDPQLLERRRRELLEAYDLLGYQPTAHLATDEQRRLVREAEDREYFAKRYAADQSAWDRICGQGFVWPGGMVAGKSLRHRFVERGLRSWRHPFLQRMVASIGRAASGTLFTGPRPDKCVIQWKKLPACDQPYAFFSTVCRDMFRMDLDRVFESEAHLRAWIADIVREHDLPCGPHIAVDFPDDRAPGEIRNPQLYFLLPEGNAVWPHSGQTQHTMLGQVIAGLTKAFGCDPGGLADPYSGKNPLSPLSRAIIYQDTHMPRLDEYFEALECSYDPVRMFRLLCAERLQAAGFDRADSNTWFTCTAMLANGGAQTLYKAGYPHWSDRTLFRRRLKESITPAVLETIKPGPADRKAVDALIDSCCRYAVENFDPANLHTKRRRDRGAAAHLMEATDGPADRMRKGQQYAASVRVRETRKTISASILAVLRSGEEPRFSAIRDATGLALNTVKNHWAAAYTTAVATLSMQALLRGYHTPGAHQHAPRDVLLTGRRWTDVPDCWPPRVADPEIEQHFRRQALVLARLRQRRPGIMRAVEATPIPGRPTLDFLSAGPVTLCRSKRACQSGVRGVADAP